MTEKKPLTRRQIEALEAAYHTGSPWSVGRPGNYHRPAYGVAGGSQARMLSVLQDRGYIVQSTGKLTSAGYHALSQDKKAMAHINPAELSERMKAAARAERDAERARIAEQEERAKARATAEAQSRKDRLAKLRELFNEHAIQIDESGPSYVPEDTLLGIAERVREIMEAY